MNKRNKYLIKNTIVFSIGNFGSKLITFFLVPLYTNILSTSEYGTVDLITTLVTVLTPIFSLNISESIMRFSLDKNTDKEQILNIGTLVFIFSTIINLLLLPVFRVLNFTREYDYLVCLFLISMTLSNLLMCYIRGNEKLLEYSILGLIQTLLIAILNIIFLIPLSLGIKGYLLSYIISHIFVSIVIIFRNKIWSKLSLKKIDKKIFNVMFKYSFLLIPNTLMWWIMNSLDKVMVTNLIGTHANGLYAVSYKIPSIVITFTTIFNQAWMFSAVKEKDSIDKDEYTNNIFKGLTTAIALSTSLILIILKPLMKIYVGIEFYSSWIYVPPLLIGTIFLTLGTFLANEYTANKDSKGFLFSSIIGAIINVILNFILISRFEIMGAAIATCVSFISVFIFRCFDTKKYVHIHYLNKVNILNIILVVLISIFQYFSSIYAYFIEGFAMFFLYIINFGFIKALFENILKKIRRKK